MGCKLSHHIGCVVHHIGVVTCATHHRIYTSATIEGVVRRITRQHIVECITQKAVGHRVGQRAVLYISPQRVGEACRCNANLDGIGALGCKLSHHIGCVVHHIGVVTRATHHPVRSSATIEGVVSSQSKKGVS